MNAFDSHINSPRINQRLLNVINCNAKTGADMTIEAKRLKIADLRDRGCVFPKRLHPVSEQFLNSYLEGRMTRTQFQRFFSLPNSTYIPLAACLVEIVG